MNLQPYIERIKHIMDAHFSFKIGRSKDSPYHHMNDEEATNAILTVMTDMLEEMVGIDEYDRTFGLSSYDGDDVAMDTPHEGAEMEARNRLRADLRAKIATLRKEIQK